MVTIFIPTYNSAYFLKRTIDSIIGQSYKNWELLCVDDSSTDHTMQILEEYSRKDSRIKCFCKPNEGSVPFSWNYIFPKISGDFTLYMSHDDILLPDSLTKLIECQKKFNADCTIPVVRFFRYDITSPEERYRKINRRYESRIGSSISGIEAFDLMLDYTIPGFGLWRTSLIKELGMPTTSFNSDEFAQRLWIKHCKIVAFSSAIFGYFQTDNSIVTGLKPYHQYSLDSNLRLFNEMNLVKGCIDSGRIRKKRYEFYMTLLYLSRVFYHQEDDYSNKDKIEINRLIDESYKVFGVLPFPKTLRESIAYICSMSRLAFKIAVKI